MRPRKGTRLAVANRDPVKAKAYQDAYYIKRCAEMTPEKKEHLREYHAKWYASRSPALIESRRRSVNKYADLYRATHREELNAKQRARLLRGGASLKDRIREMRAVSSKKPGRNMLRYFYGAKRRGHDFNLTKEQFMTFWQKPCHYCGDSIETVGIDRMDHMKGYEISNCVPCCTPCNRGKMVQSYQEFIDRAHRISERHKVVTAS